MILMKKLVMLMVVVMWIVFGDDGHGDGYVDGDGGRSF